MKFDYENLNNRIVLNLTNKCTERCPFCFMSCGRKNDNFLSLDQIKSIWETAPVETEKVEVQLTGGEPSLHPDFIEIVRYFSEKSNMKYIIIDSNGSEIENFMDELYEISQNSGVCIAVKISVNYYLMEKYPWHLEKIKSLYNKYHHQDIFEVILSVRYRTPKTLDQPIIDEICNDEVLSKAYKIIKPIHYLGRAVSSKLGNTLISGGMHSKTSKPLVYASDGTYFGADYNARNEYEITISNER